MSGFQKDIKPCHRGRGFDKRTNRCRMIIPKKPGSSHLKSIRLPVPSENVVVNFSNSVMWYSVIVPTSGTLQADTESTLTNIDTKICIYNSDGSLFWQNDDSGNEPNPYLSNVSAPGLTAGTYYIVVGFTGMQFGENFTITTNNIQPQNGVLLSVTFTPTPVPIPGLFSTGQGISNGEIDQNYTVIYARHPDRMIPMRRIDASSVRGGYVDDANSGFIGYEGDYNGATYKVETTFDLTGFDLDTVSISLRLYYNDRIYGTDYSEAPKGVFLNGVNIISGIGLPENTVVDATITSGFQPGINTFRFEWQNQYGSCAIRAILSGTGFLIS